MTNQMEKEKVSPSPWHPAVALGLMIIFGIYAAGIETALNFKRLGYKKWFWPILVIVALFSAPYLWLLFKPAPGWTYSSTNILIALVFYFIQAGPVKKWRQAHPQEKLASVWPALGWGLLGAAILFPVIMFISFLSP